LRTPKEVELHVRCIKCRDPKSVRFEECSHRFERMGSGKIADDRNDSILSLKLLQPLKQLLGRKEILPAALAVGLQKHLLESRVHHGVPAANGRESKIEVLFPKCTIDVVDFSQITGREFQLVLVREQTPHAGEIFLEELF